MLRSILAHPLVWYLTIIFSYAARLIDPERPFNFLVVDPFWAFFGSIFLSLCSLILVGWLTLLMSAIISAGLVFLLRRQNPVFQLV
jgi:hypothetical protein